MKWWVSAVVVLVLLVGAQALQVQVDVVEKADAQVLVFQEPAGVLRLVADVRNTGSTPLAGRPRVELWNASGRVATLWGGAVVVEPGSTAGSEMDWYDPAHRELEARIRFVTLTDVVEGRALNVTLSPGASADPFGVSAVRTAGDYIRLEVRSSAEMGEVFVFPVDSPPGWVIEPARIASIPAGKAREARLRYETGLFRERFLAVRIASADGSAVRTERLWIERRPFIEDVFAQLGEWLRSLL